METPKLEKSVTAPAPKSRSLEALLFAAGVLLAVSLIANIALYNRYDLAQSVNDYYSRNFYTMKDWNESLRQELDDMTATAGAYRSYGVYHDCVQQNLGIYQMKEVARAYDRHFRSTELTGRCLAESDWYKTHPVGINPAHLNR